MTLASTPRDPGARSAPLVLGLAQLRPAKGEVERNVAAVKRLVGEWKDRVDVLVFPEATTTGYFLEGGVRDGALSVDDLVFALGRPPEESPDLILGFFESSRGRVFNSAIHFTPDGERFEAVHVHRKVFLPTYGVFQEARFVDPGSEVRAYDSRFGRLGMLVCEDAWHSLAPAILALDGAELVVIPSASPARGFAPSGGLPGNLEQWDSLASAASTEHGIFVAVAQLVGSEGGKLFPGGSVLAGPEGGIKARGPLLEEGVVVVELDPESLDRARGRAPLLADLEERLPVLRRELTRIVEGPEEPSPQETSASARSSGLGAPGGERERGRARGGGGGEPLPGDLTVLDLDAPLVERALLEFIRDEVRGRGFERVVLGVSGGVDSAVSLLLAARALGPENVFGFRLPHATSSQESLDHADLVLDLSGANRETIEITGPVDAYIAGRGDELSPLRRGNLAARIRSVILFDQSAHLRALPLGTGNKSERLLGYFTWHADDSPPVNPLGDLFKTQVWALARHLGVPDSIVEKPATADLVKGVNDEDELGIAYHRADPILHWLLLGFDAEELVARGFPTEEVRLVLARLDSTHWKRELPTVAMLSATAIGESYLRPVDYLGRRGVPSRGPAAGGPDRAHGTASVPTGAE